MGQGTFGGLETVNVFKVNIRMLLTGQFIQTGFKLRDLAVQDNTCETVANAVLPWVTDHFKALLVNTTQLVSLDVTQLYSENGFTHPFTGVTGNVGAAASQILPSFCAVNIALKTQRRKRYGQGRMFWPIQVEDWNDSGVLSATGLTGYQSVLDALMSSFSGSVLTHDLVLCNTHGVIPAKVATSTSPARPEIPASWYDVESVKINTTLTSLRTRKIGIGQ